MIFLPSRRWLIVAGALSIIAPLSLWWRGAGVVLFAADLCWLLLWVVDGALTPAGAPCRSCRGAGAAS